MNQVCPVFKREFLGYFRSPVAYVVLAAFLLVVGAVTFFLMDFFDRGTANLEPMFVPLVFLYVFFIPAVAMRLWAEERRSGTIELMFTLPVSTTAAVIGKFLAAWAFISVGVILTFPLAITVGYLGDPDWGVIFASYLAAILLAAPYLGISSLASALTRNQVVAFVIGLFVCLMFAIVGLGRVNDLLGGVLPVGLVDVIANFGFYPHFDAIARGLLSLGSLIYFFSLTAFALLVNVIVLER
ncbi:MAG: ABC transporter permease subunit [Opitutaceae bacterium]|nr:ABC transporter permease subunit [Opitutaceae bacterium]